MYPRPKSPDELIRDSWHLFDKNIKRFVSVFVVSILLVILVSGLFMIPVALATSIVKSPVVVALIVLISIIFFIVITQWFNIVLFTLIKKLGDGNYKNIKDVFADSTKLVVPGVVLSLISILSVIGGFVAFIIPGIILSIWFSFSYILLIDEGIKGVPALIKSARIIKGLSFTYISHILVLVIISYVISLLGMLVASIFSYFDIRFVSVGINFVTSIFSSIYMSVYMFMLYRDFRQVNPVKNTDSDRKAKSGILFLIVLSLASLIFISIGVSSLIKNNSLDIPKLMREIEPKNGDMFQDAENEDQYMDYMNETIEPNDQVDGMLDTMEEGVGMDGMEGVNQEDAAAL